MIILEHTFLLFIICKSISDCESKAVVRQRVQLTSILNTCYVESKMMVSLMVNTANDHVGIKINIINRKLRIL